MRRGVTMIGFVVSGLLLAACSGGSGGSSAAPGSGNPSGGTLEGPTWQLTSYSVGGTLQTVPGGVYVDARFAAGRVAGSAGCNGYSGGYQVSGSSLTIGPVAATKMFCPPPAGTVESDYLAALDRVAAYAASPTTLTLFGAGGATILQYAAAPGGGLTGVTWHVVAYNNGKQAVQSVAGGSDPTATFTVDGTVSGNATCNTYHGPATTRGNQITIGPLASTRMACASDALNAQEAAILAALQGAETFDVQGNRLELRDAGDALMIQFERR